MVRPAVWWVLPSLAITPGKTFFGLDKNAAHCFTIDKRLYDGIQGLIETDVLHVSENQKTWRCRFLIGNVEFQAEIRRIDMSPSKTNPDRRTVYQFQWAKFEGTRAVIRDRFSKAFNDVRDDDQTDIRIVFHHLGDDMFLVRQSAHRIEWSKTEIQR